jgi:peptide/nickel transport system permease protein
VTAAFVDIPVTAAVTPGSARWRLLLRSPAGVAGLVLAASLVLLAGASLVGVLPYGALDQDPSAALHAPSLQHWFGTDQFGRDVFARTAQGVRLSLQVAVVAIALAATVGTAAGVIAGFLGGVLESAIMAIADVLFAFPAILLALVIVTALGTGWFNTAVAVGVVYTPIFARVARGPVLALRDREFVLAGRVLGFSSVRLLSGHILPNVMPVVVVQITVSLAWAILTESSLSFLGLGTQPPNASLGLMVSDGTSLATLAWWTLVAPAAVLTVAVLSTNLLGDALRDVLDPTSDLRR